MQRRYLKVWAYCLLCGAVGPLFVVMYFASGRDPFLTWFLWSGLLVTAGTVFAAVRIAGSARRSAAKLAALEGTGVLASADIMRVHETGTHINDHHWSSWTFSSRDRALRASPTKTGSSHRSSACP